MDIKTFYDSFKDFDKDTFVGLEDVIETLEVSDQKAISNLMNSIDERTEAIRNGASEEELAKLSQKCDAAFEHAFSEMDKIPTFDSAEQTRAEYLDEFQPDSLKKSWKEIRQESALRVKELNDRQAELEKDISKLGKNYVKLSEKAAALQAKLDISDFTADQKKESQNVIDNYMKQLSAMKARIDAENIELASVVRENTLQTMINNYAKTQQSQIAAIQREKTLGEVRGWLEERQNNLKDRVHKLGEEIKKVGPAMERLAERTGNSFVIFAKTFKADFIDKFVSVRESKHIKDLEKNFEELNTAKQKRSKIEEKITAKYNKDLKRDFDHKTRANKIAKFLGHEIPFKDVGKEFVEQKLSPDAYDKYVTKFQEKQLERINKEIGKQETNLTKVMQAIVQDNAKRRELLEKTFGSFEQKMADGKIFEKDAEFIEQKAEELGYGYRENIENMIVTAIKDGTLENDFADKYRDDLKNMGIDIDALIQGTDSEYQNKKFDDFDFSELDNIDAPEIGE